METHELLNEARKMCEVQTNCASCGLHGNCFFTHRPKYISDAMIKKFCSEVEKWSKANQPITNAQKFEEVFGEIKIKDLIHIVYNCTSIINDLTIEVNETNWWDEPYKEPKHED